jgi:hypothetical protein
MIANCSSRATESRHSFTVGDMVIAHLVDQVGHASSL